MVAAKKDKETPAEQLLRMIEGSPAGGGAVSVARPALGRSIAAWFSRLRGRGSSWDKADPLIGKIRLASRLMWVALAALGAYTAMTLMRPAAPVPSAVPGAPGSGEDPSAVAEEVPFKPLSEYLSSITTINPFTGGASQGQSPTVPVTETARQKLEGIAGSLLVVGIDRSTPPEAIIEDTEIKRTYFVKIGDGIKGLTVREIGDKGVVVSYEGEETTLR